MISYIQANSSEILSLLFEHLFIVVIGIFIASMFAIPLAALSIRYRVLRENIFLFANTMITIPSIALFGLMIPLLSLFDAGIGKTQAIIALVLYSQLPILRNCYTGFKGVNPSVIDAARGIGYKPIQLFFQIELPLATPFVMSGLRNAVVMGVGITTIAAYVGAGGLGVLIQQGISRTNMDMVVAGAVLASLLAILLDMCMAVLQKLLTPKVRSQ